MKHIRNKIGGFFKVLGYIFYVIFGLWGLIISFQIVGIVFGSKAAFLSLLVLPFMYGIAPLYALFTWGSWFPLLIGYGGGLVGLGFVTLGDWIKGHNNEPSSEFSTDIIPDSIAIQICGKPSGQLNPSQKEALLVEYLAIQTYGAPLEQLNPNQKNVLLGKYVSIKTKGTPLESLTSEQKEKLTKLSMKKVEPLYQYKSKEMREKENKL